VRRLGLVLVLALVAGGLAACGSGHGSNSAEDQIKSAYATFFSPKTSLSGRVAALQNGSQFKSVIQGFASNPLAKSASATVSSVTLQGANKAKVVYVIKLGGTSLPKQTGTAVRENGTWKVGYASLCRLVELQGTTPPACKNATS
jgi:hypothetical protein